MSDKTQNNEKVVISVRVEKEISEFLKEASEEYKCSQGEVLKMMYDALDEKKGAESNVEEVEKKHTVLVNNGNSTYENIVFTGNLLYKIACKKTQSGIIDKKYIAFEIPGYMHLIKNLKEFRYTFEIYRTKAGNCLLYSMIEGVDSTGKCKIYSCCANLSSKDATRELETLTKVAPIDEVLKAIAKVAPVVPLD